MENIERIIDIVADITGADKSALTEGSAIGNTEGWDSLAHVQIISEFEAAFDVSLPFEKIAEVKTVADFAALLN